MLRRRWCLNVRLSTRSKRTLDRRETVATQRPAGEEELDLLEDAGRSAQCLIRIGIGWSLSDPRRCIAWLWYRNLNLYCPNYRLRGRRRR
jgi:hypothetical protein